MSGPSKPPIVPKGWRRLRKGTRILKGDKFWCAGTHWQKSGNYHRDNEEGYVGYPIYMFGCGKKPLTYIRKSPKKRK